MRNVSWNYWSKLFSTSLWIRGRRRVKQLILDIIHIPSMSLVVSLQWKLTLNGDARLDCVLVRNFIWILAKIVVKIQGAYFISDEKDDGMCRRYKNSIVKVILDYKGSMANTISEGVSRNAYQIGICEGYGPVSCLGTSTSNLSSMVPFTGGTTTRYEHNTTQGNG